LGAQLQGKKWADSGTYWQKIDLFIGGSWDFHYDWDSEILTNTLATIAGNIEQIKKVNPHALVLPYVDVSEAPPNLRLPSHWWRLDDKGKKVSTWPGFFQIKTELPEVLKFNLEKTRDVILSKDFFDGVFYDCWGPDNWLVPETAKLRNGKAIVMFNTGNLPGENFDRANGALSEDEINIILDSKVDFENFLNRYLRWNTECRKPTVTTIVCRPRSINDDPWRWWSTLIAGKRQWEMEKARLEDQQTMRFGLATALMGDGYFAYDAGTMNRGNWWCYKEYDALLGYPKGAAYKNSDGTWQREYEGGTVIVNGTHYDAVVNFSTPHKDISTKRVSTTFTLPFFDGRIFLPSQEPLTVISDITPRITPNPYKELRTISLPDGLTAVQTSSGLELRLKANGVIKNILWQGDPVMYGGFPTVMAPPWKEFSPEDVSNSMEEQTPQQKELITLWYKGKLVVGKQRVGYIEKCTIYNTNSFDLHFDFYALTDLDLRMWRHYFAFPVLKFQNTVAQCDQHRTVLPEVLENELILPYGKFFTFESNKTKIKIESSLPMALIDHRKYGAFEYLLAGYPVGNTVKKGEKWLVDITVTFSNNDLK